MSVDFTALKAAADQLKATVAAGSSSGSTDEQAQVDAITQELQDIDTSLSPAPAAAVPPPSPSLTGDNAPSSSSENSGSSLAIAPAPAVEGWTPTPGS